MSSNEEAKVIDVRTVEPRYRHPLIFKTFDDLQPGQHFMLVNDHAPTPLYYQFMHERTDMFTWNYVEEGPEVWRVQIGRKDS